MKQFVMRAGDKGQEVKRLQMALKCKFIDGDFGPGTESDLKDYQEDHGLSSDGVAGPVTLDHLGIPVLAGIDIYNGNGKVNWKEVAKDGVSFAWIKCSEGTTFKDKSRKRNMTAVRNAGLIVGGYHFGRPDNGPKQDFRDAIQEADNFLASIKGHVRCGDLIPMLDLEAGSKSDDSYNAEWALTWLEYVEAKLGCKPGIYCAKWASDLYLKHADEDLLKRLSKYPCWWASYNTGIEPKRGVRVWNQWDVWQWTGSGSTAGVKGKCDKNWMCGSGLDRLLIK
jgi:lysozyme